MTDANSVVFLCLSSVKELRAKSVDCSDHKWKIIIDTHCVAECQGQKVTKHYCGLLWSSEQYANGTNYWLTSYDFLLVLCSDCRFRWNCYWDISHYKSADCNFSTRIRTAPWSIRRAAFAGLTYLRSVYLFIYLFIYLFFIKSCTKYMTDRHTVRTSLVRNK